MRKRHAIVLAAAATVLFLGVTADSLAQGAGGRGLTRDPILRGNPMRDAGGSCVYDRNGRVVFSPDGKECRDRRNHLDTELNEENSNLVNKFPPAMRQELARLINDHDHIASEVARLHVAIRTGGRDEAMKIAEKVGVELTDHNTREERFLEQLSPASKRRSR